MPSPRRPAAGWGPKRLPALVCLTFDHLGEAAAIEQGRWPFDAPVGQHASATEAVPWLVETMGAAGVRATFFVEGWNAAVYPDTLRALIAAGHEVGYHGWRHESWHGLSEDLAADLLDRGVAAFGDLAIQLQGFRAPGGSQPLAVARLLRERGFTYVSLPGSEVGVQDGLASLPYEWEQVDALYYSPSLRVLRDARGLGPDPLPPALLAERLDAALDRCLASGGYLTLLFHTQFLDTPERRAVFERALRRIAGAGEAWCAPDREVAAWALDHQAELPRGWHLAQESWDPTPPGPT